MWAPTSDRLLSFDDFNASVGLSDYFEVLPPPTQPCSGCIGDVTNSGYKSVRLAFAPVGNADCVSLRIRISTAFFAGYSIVSGAGVVNVTGNLQVRAGAELGVLKRGSDVHRFWADNRPHTPSAFTPRSCAPSSTPVHAPLPNARPPTHARSYSMTRQTTSRRSRSSA